jgi:hypothetical protein
MRLEYHRTIIGYHGCDAEVLDRVLRGDGGLVESVNDYDWLGRGIYFWEHGPSRAMDWANETHKRKPDKLKNPAVIGALIHLGNCFDLLDTTYTEFLRDSFPEASKAHELKFPDKPLPENKGPDLRERYLDCAIVNWAIDQWEKVGGEPIQSVRCAFTEGKPVFENSGIMLKSHIQIAIRDDSCILGYFRPS